MSLNRQKDLQVWLQEEAQKVAQAMASVMPDGLVEDQKTNPFAATEYGYNNPGIFAGPGAVINRALSKLSLEFNDITPGMLGFLLGIHAAGRLVALKAAAEQQS